MRTIRRRLVQWWTRYGAFLLGGAFAAGFFALMVRKHGAFHTNALDLAKFDQAIWNTLHGRLLFTSIQNYSVLGNHFSPILALLSPLYLIWPDVRALFLVQVVCLAAAGLLLYRMVQMRHPALAPWFLLAFYLNPALHEVALVEFRRVTLAVPFLALALYGLYVRKRSLTVLGLAVALLCKEDIALIVLMVGVYLLLFERDWAWGTALAAIGVAWGSLALLVVIPALAPADTATIYPGYFGLAGDTLGEIVASVAGSLHLLLRRAVDRQALLALWRVLLPVGLVLPFLAADWLLMILPTVALMLMSAAPAVHRLGNWYMATVLPGLFGAVAVGLNRASELRARALVVGLLGAATLGFALYSEAPLGGKYRSETFVATAHHRLASQAVDAVPSDAAVAAQDPYVPHLSQREHIYLYPWIPSDGAKVEYLLLDRHLSPYPLQPAEMNARIDDLIADTSYTMAWEADGIYLFQRGGAPWVAFAVDAVAGGSMRLDRVEVAAADEEGIYRPSTRQPLELAGGQELRVSLYWEALYAPDAERTISVRLLDGSGALIAQQDNLPGQGKKPTSWWEGGWQVRDVYYVTVPPSAPIGPARLCVLVYDSYSQEVIPFGEGEGMIDVALAEIVSGLGDSDP